MKCVVQLKNQTSTSLNYKLNLNPKSNQINQLVIKPTSKLRQLWCLHAHLLPQRLQTNSEHHLSNRFNLLLLQRRSSPFDTIRSLSMENPHLQVILIYQQIISQFKAPIIVHQVHRHRRSAIDTILSSKNTHRAIIPSHILFKLNSARRPLCLLTNADSRHNWVHLGSLPAIHFISNQCVSDILPLEPNVNPIRSIKLWSQGELFKAITTENA
jgi:hypothetical protein